ncbi:MAG: hypothetical protein ABJA37_11935 [Ferruginibacter sp.]
MKYYCLLLFTILFSIKSYTQKLPPPNPCAADVIYRQFDFWIGDWEAFNLKGKKAGDSKISLILDSCVILEEWTNVQIPNGIIYKGKSFNTYNAFTKQWQQTWVDNVGSSTHYVHGKYEDGKIIFQTDPWLFSKDTMAINKLTFFNLGRDKVRQLGEISKNNGNSWTTQYDLEYRRKQ